MFSYLFIDCGQFTQFAQIVFRKFFHDQQATCEFDDNISASANTLLNVAYILAFAFDFFAYFAAVLFSKNPDQLFCFCCLESIFGVKILFFSCVTFLLFQPFIWSLKLLLWMGDNLLKLVQSFSFLIFIQLRQL